MQDEMIPLSANIFHEKGNQEARTVAALDIVLYSGKCTTEEHNFIGKMKERLMPVGYDVRAELVAALCGDDTAAPLPPQDAKGPTYIVAGHGRRAVFSSREAAIECASSYGLKIFECVIDDPVPRSD